MNVGCCRRGHLFKLKIDTSEEMEEDVLPPQVLGEASRQGKKDGKKRLVGEGGQMQANAGTAGNSGSKKSSQVKARKKAKKEDLVE